MNLSPALLFMASLGLIAICAAMGELLAAGYAFAL